MAPPPKQKPVVEEEEVMVKERLYKLEVFTSDLVSAGTNANVSTHDASKMLRNILNFC